ncbi:MAG: hypothetical protein P8168_06515 [Deltaproteobacteria bacterium]|jgi:hypothetical protein
MKKIIALFLILLVAALASPALSQDKDGELCQPPANIFTTVPDLMIVRPLAAAGAIVTTSLFVATLPMTYPLAQDLKLSQILVHKPWTYVADRQMGVFVPKESVEKGIDTAISEQYQVYFVRVGADLSPIDLK